MKGGNLRDLRSRSGSRSIVIYSSRSPKLYTSLNHPCYFSYTIALQNYESFPSSFVFAALSLASAARGRSSISAERRTDRRPASGPGLGPLGEPLARDSRLSPDDRPVSARPSLRVFRSKERVLESVRASASLSFAPRSRTVKESERGSVRYRGRWKCAFAPDEFDRLRRGCRRFRREDDRVDRARSKVIDATPGA